MKYFPVENFELRSPLAAAEIVRRLQGKTGPQTFRRKLIQAEPAHEYEGVVSEKEFTVSRCIRHRNSFLPVIRGELASGSAGGITWTVDSTPEANPNNRIGTVTIDGNVNRLKIGGQEFWIESVCAQKVQN